MTNEARMALETLDRICDDGEPQTRAAWRGACRMPVEVFDPARDELIACGAVEALGTDAWPTFRPAAGVLR